MNQEDILKIVEEAFDEEISSMAFQSSLGLESEIQGKNEFMEKIKEKLNNLFNENDLSKF